MKPFKRSNYCKQTTDPISQAWEEWEKKERLRIQRETDLAWAEYDAKNNADYFDNEDYTIEVEEYFQNLENIDEAEESESYEEDEPEVVEFLNPKNQKRGIRRRKTAHAKNRLMQKSKVAMKNSAKRKEVDSKNHVKISKKNTGKDENDLKNLCINSTNIGVKSRVAKLIILRKRVKNNVL